MFGWLKKIFTSDNYASHCPELFQIEATECGAISLAMVMENYGVILPPEVLRDECQVSRDGSTASGLLKTARKYGFQASGYRIAELDDILRHPMPAILFWEFNHFLVCVGKRGEKWILHDPAVGHRVVTNREMSESFTGILLEITPGPACKKQGKHPSLLHDLKCLLTSCHADVLLLLTLGILMLPGTVLQPNMNSLIIDYFFNEGYYHWGTPILCLGLFFMVMTGGLLILQQLALLSLNLRLSSINAYNLLKKLFSLPLLFFQARFSGDLTNRILRLDQIAAFLTENFVRVLLNLLSIILFSALLLHFDNVLGTIVVVASGSMLVLLMVFLRRNQASYTKVAQEDGKAAGILMHGLSMLENLKASGMENEFFIRWTDAFKTSWRGYVNVNEETRWVYYLPLAFSNIFEPLLVGLGAYRILSGSLTSGTYMAFQMIAGCMMGPVMEMVALSNTFQQIRSQITRLLDIQNYPVPQVPSETTAEDEMVIRNSKLDGRIAIHDLTFGYNKNLPPVVDHIDLEIAPGERVAIVGTTGSGKSTLAKLLTGCYIPWSGEILLDGYPRQSYSISELRYSFSCVDQEITLFPGTIYDNLSMFDSTLSFSQIRQAAEDALIHDAIIARRRGYSSEVNATASNFSGGERQRLEIARALAVNPSILVLDEATASLDPATEVKIDRNLRRRGVTTIVIAHRLSTIRDADRIIVLDHGRIAEQGSHQELMKQNGIYAKLVSL